MTIRAQYFIQILDKIGSPLMRSVLAGRKEGDDPAADAQKMAELLTKSVQASVAMGDMVEVGKMGEKADAMRVALAALAADLVAEGYKVSGKTPDDAEVKRITEALQAAMTFSENFTPNAENVAALESLDADHPNAHVQTIQAFTPVIHAVQTFPFGQKESKLVTEITSRLVSLSENLADKIGEADKDIKKQIALGILKALAEIYSTCHKSETDRILALNDDQRGDLSLEPVWKLFDARIELLETLIENMLTGGKGSSQASTKAPEPAAETEAPPPPPPPTEEKKPEAPAGSNPMSMFAKKPDADADTDADSDAPPPAPPAESPPPPPPPEKPADETPESNEDTGQKPPDSGNGNPMSFFKSPPKDES